MDKAELRNIKADTPLSITDGAPPIVEHNGTKFRIPSGMDYRIVMVVSQACKDLDEWDTACLLVYCCMHTSKSQIAKLWKAARAPQALLESVVQWQAITPIGAITDAVEFVMGFDKELDEQAALDAGGAGGGEAKKKTGSR